MESFHACKGMEMGDRKSVFEEVYRGKFDRIIMSMRIMSDKFRKVGLGKIVKGIKVQTEFIFDSRD